MKVLWFTNTPSLYGQQKSGYHGGGWIESLEREVQRDKSIDLGISFFYETTIFKEMQNGVTYYPTMPIRALFKKVYYKVFSRKKEQRQVSSLLRVVDDFKPDLIHIFGSENLFGLITKSTKIPVVLHIQGVLIPYLNAWFPPNHSIRDFYCNWRFYESLRRLRDLSSFSGRAKREKDMLASINNFMGRTEWDKKLSNLFSPDSQYFYVSEILREAFYNADPWMYHNKDKMILTTTISRPLYKGFDLVLKTAKVLTEYYYSKDFEWHVFGNVDLEYAERMTSIVAEEVNVFCKGVASAEVLVEKIQYTDIFVHPSYIDNSPNSICEAQLLGAPVISTNVGGVSSLIEDCVTGILVPANDPYYLAATIIDLLGNPHKMKCIGSQARVNALKRHNRDRILEDLLFAYNQILKNS